jgi:hypothetical protein
MHYGSHGMAECGAHGDGRVDEALLTKDPKLVTCRTCRGWLPLVVWPAPAPAEERETPVEGCINCGESNDGGYMSGFEGDADEGAVGPLL